MAKSPHPHPNDTPVEPTELGSGKGRATPSRAEQEAAASVPLVPDTKEAKARRAPRELAAQREKARIGMAAAKRITCPSRDRGPQRRFARDFVDAGLPLGGA